MRAKLLGTSAAEGWPGLFCRCDACNKARQMGGKNIRTRTTTLLDDVLKIDFPPDTLYHVIKYNLDLRALKALLFTHAHDDHFAAPELQYLCPYFVPTPVEPLPIYGPRDVIQYLESRFDLNFVPLELHTLRVWKTENVAGYRVTPIPAQHDPEQVCFNYIIEDPKGATLLYASDSGWYEEPTWEFLEQTHLDGIIVECAKGLKEEGYTGHLSIPEVIRFRLRLLEAGALRPEAPVVTTHFSHLCGLMHNDLEAVFSPQHITPGYDGMEFSIKAASSVKSSRMTAPRVPVTS